MKQPENANPILEHMIETHNDQVHDTQARVMDLKGYIDIILDNEDSSDNIPDNKSSSDIIPYNKSSSDQDKEEYEELLGGLSPAAKIK